MKLKNVNFTAIKNLYFKQDIDRFFLVKKTINISLLTGIMIIKLNCYI